jgi:PAS domain S-box-containing protein
MDDANGFGGCTISTCEGVRCRALDAVADPVLVADPRGVIRYVNHAFELQNGYTASEAVGQTPRLLRSGRNGPEVYASLWGTILSGAVWRGVLINRRKDGTVTAAELTVAPMRAVGGSTYFVATHRDITERRQLLGKVLELERIAELGTLAASVGHEINNPLAFVCANLEFSLRALASAAAADGGSPPLAEVAAALRDAQVGADRVRRIVGELRTFARVGDERATLLRVEPLLDSALAAAAGELRRRARVRRDFSETPAVRAVESRLARVFLNLVVNAAQAIPDGDPDGNEVRVCSHTDGDAVVVEVTDPGVGIARENLERIFLPFYTTKPKGQGTGLGLSISRDIVAAHGGELQVESAPGRGATFRVRLPGAVGASPASELPARVTRARLLLVDDEPMVVSALRRLLSTDHEVTATTSALEALRRVERGERYDVILCDLLMTEMTGMTLHAKVAAQDAAQGARMVFITGGAVTTEARAFVERNAARCLSKPLDLTQLRALLARMLG